MKPALVDRNRTAGRVSRRRLTRSMVALGATCLLGIVGTPATAQDWPTKPVRIVVGFSAGSTTDTMARVVGEQMSKVLGQPVVVENRAGANGAIGATEVANAAADGYTMLGTNSSSITVNPQLYRKAGYQPERDFTPVSMVVSSPFVLVVNAESPRTASIKTVADLVALAKAQPGKLTYGSGGPGNLAHLAFAKLANRTGIEAAHVPYKAGTAAQLGLRGGEIDTMFDTPLALPHIQAGKLRALAVTSSARLPSMPDVPTMAEAGYPDFDVTFWLGLLVPKATPAPIVDRLYAAIKSVADNPNAVKQLEPHGKLELLDPAAFAARIKSETASWGEVIRQEKIQLD